MYEVKGYEALFDQPTREEQIELLRQERVARYRVKTVKSGRILEAECYPLYKLPEDARRARELRTRDVQARLNAANAKKKFERLVNANFGPRDSMITYTYCGVAPGDEQAYRDMRNLIRRLRTKREGKGLPPLKYLYAIESEEEGRDVRVHCHLIVNHADREELEELWGKGFANCRRLQPNDNGLQEIAKYMLKSRNRKKRWQGSKNLKQPEITTADHKLSRRQVTRLAADCMREAKPIFERAYPGYRYVSCEVRHSDYLAGAYVYARMIKRDVGAREMRGEARCAGGH